MAQVNLKINGYAYLVGCEDGQEPHLEAMAAAIQQRIEGVRAMGQQSEARSLLLAALLLADELHDKDAAIGSLRAQAQMQAALPPAPAERLPAAAAPEPEIVHVIDPEFAATVSRLAAKAEEIAEALERP